MYSSRKKSPNKIIPLILCIVVAIGVSVACYRLLARAWLYVGLPTQLLSFTPKIEIPNIEINHDEDNDGIKDLADIVEGARQEVARAPAYHSNYYQGGYPREEDALLYWHENISKIIYHFRWPKI